MREVALLHKTGRKAAECPACVAPESFSSRGHATASGESNPTQSLKRLSRSTEEPRLPAPSPGALGKLVPVAPLRIRSRARVFFAPGRASLTNFHAWPSHLDQGVGEGERKADSDTVTAVTIDGVLFGAGEQAGLAEAGYPGESNERCSAVAACRQLCWAQSPTSSGSPGGICM